MQENNTYSAGLYLRLSKDDEQQGESVSIGTQRSILTEYCSANGYHVHKIYIDFDVTPHQLRHTYITNLLYAGVDPKTVQYLAGHENSKTTMDIYAKIKYNQPKELVGVVNAAFNQPIAV